MNKIMKKIGGGGNKGFTLVEMLIVVAIIAILVAISIPLVNNALEKARHATDAANERAAKAAILLAYMEEVEIKKADNSAPEKVQKDKEYCYDAARGKMIIDTPAATYGQHKGHAKQYIKASLDTDTNVVTIKWTGTAETTSLCSEKGVTHPS